MSIRLFASRWRRPAVALAALTVAGLPAAAQSPTPADSRPTLAVMYFTNGAFGKGTTNGEYAPLSKGMAEMMITELSQNDAIRVVERDRLQSLLEEQNLQNTDRVDKETAVRLGKILGAVHMLMGTFVVQDDIARLDVRCINTETSAVEFATSVTGKTNKILSLVIDLGAKTNKELKLPALKTASTTEGAAKNPNQFRALLLTSRALEAEDKKNTPQAIALYKEALQANPDMERAKVLLASAERTQK